MPLSPEQLAARTRLLTYYDGDAPYDPVTNPGGLRRGGNVPNFEPALKDVALAGQGVGALVDDAVAAAGQTEALKNQAQTAVATGRVTYDTLAQLQANLAPGDGAQGEVLTGTGAGLYQKSGASGSGSWSFKSAATVPSLDQRARTLEGRVQSRAQREGLAVTDERGNAALLSSRKKFTTAVLKALRRAVSSGIAISDEAGYALIHVTKTAIRHPVIDKVLADIARLITATASLKPRLSGAGFALTDESGNALLRVTRSDLGHPVIRDLRKAVLANAAALRRGAGQAPDWPTAIALAELQHVVIYGQSLSIGQTAVPPLSTAPLPYAYRFNGGVRSVDGGTDAAATRASLQGLFEQYSPNQARGETPASGAAMMAFQLLRDEDGIDLSATTQRMLLSAPGEGGMSIASLSAGAYLQRLYDDITYGKARAGDLGQSHVVSALGFVHGEQDTAEQTNPETYKSAVRALREMAQSKANEVSGLARTLPMFLCQTATHLHYGRPTPAIALAQLALAGEAAFCFVTPKHMLAYSADGNHITNVSTLWLGAYYGLALKRALFDGIKVKPLLPEASEINGTTILLHFPSAVGGLVLDTVTTPDPGNYGFSLADAGGAAIAISSVGLVGPRTVAIRAAAPVAAGTKVRNAWIGDGERGRGNLRDRQGDAIVFDPTGYARPLHRWAPIFERTL